VASAVPRLTDIIEAIEHIRSETTGVTLDAFAATGVSGGSWNAALKSSLRPAAI
jgi:hypothetical protein